MPPVSPLRRLRRRSEARLRAPVPSDLAVLLSSLNEVHEIQWAIGSTPRSPTIGAHPPPVSVRLGSAQGRLARTEPGAIGELVGGVAVIATLFYLAELDRFFGQSALAERALARSMVAVLITIVYFRSQREQVQHPCSGLRSFDACAIVSVARPVPGPT